MGLILDSSAAVSAERQGKNPKQLLQAIALETGDDEVGISVLTTVALALWAGQIDDHSQAKGIRIPIS